MVHRLFETTVFIVGLKKNDNGCSCVDHAVCGIILKRAIDVCLWHCTACINGGKEEPVMAAHVVVASIETCCVSFLSEEIAYRDIVEKYDGLHSAALDVFCQHKAMTVSLFHRLLVQESYRCAQALTTTLDTLKRLVMKEHGSDWHKKLK